MLLLDKGRRTSLAWPFAERSIKGSPTIFRVPPKKVERGPLMMDRVPLPTKAAFEEEAAAAFEAAFTVVSVHKIMHRSLPRRQEKLRNEKIQAKISREGGMLQPLPVHGDFGFFVSCFGLLDG